MSLNIDSVKAFVADDSWRSFRNDDLGVDLSVTVPHKFTKTAEQLPRIVEFLSYVWHLAIRSFIQHSMYRSWTSHQHEQNETLFRKLLAVFCAPFKKSKKLLNGWIEAKKKRTTQHQPTKQTPTTLRFCLRLLRLSSHRSGKRTINNNQ